MQYYNELNNFDLYDKSLKTGWIVADLFSFDIHVYDKSFISFWYDPPLNGRWKLIYLKIFKISWDTLKILIYL